MKHNHWEALELACYQKENSNLARCYIELTKQRDELLNLLRTVASISHCGGLAEMSESDALTAVRVATLPYFETDASEKHHTEAIARVKNATQT